MMLLDAIATVVLAGMMLIPLVNVFTAVTVGAGLAGVPGAAIGLLLVAAVTFAEKLIGERRGWFDVKCIAEAKTEAARAEAAQRTPAASVVKRPPLQRRPWPSLQRKRRLHPAGRVAASRAAPSPPLSA